MTGAAHFGVGHGTHLTYTYTPEGKICGHTALSTYPTCLGNGASTDTLHLSYPLPNTEVKLHPGFQEHLLRGPERHVSHSRLRRASPARWGQQEGWEQLHGVDLWVLTRLNGGPPHLTQARRRLCVCQLSHTHSLLTPGGRGGSGAKLSPGPHSQAHREVVEVRVGEGGGVRGSSVVCALPMVLPWWRSRLGCGSQIPLISGCQWLSL